MRLPVVAAGALGIIVLTLLFVSSELEYWRPPPPRHDMTAQLLNAIQAGDVEKAERLAGELATLHHEKLVNGGVSHIGGVEMTTTDTPKRKSRRERRKGKRSRPSRSTTSRSENEVEVEEVAEEEEVVPKKKPRRKPAENAVEPTEPEPSKPQAQSPAPKSGGGKGRAGYNKEWLELKETAGNGPDSSQHGRRSTCSEQGAYVDGQCSHAVGPQALKACEEEPGCVSVNCNSGRDRCQLRYGELQLEQNTYFTSWVPPGTCRVCEPDKKVCGRCGDDEKCIQDYSNLRICVDCPRYLCMPKTIKAPKGECGFNKDDGELKCVVSYGLYGSNPKYVQGALENVLLGPKVFPGWYIRFYHDDSVPKAKLDELNSYPYVELRRITDIGGAIAGMFWRFLVADDDTVDRYIIRDSDSRLNPREKGAVDDWIASGFAVHTIRDHPNHNRPINGGMWGGAKGAFKYGESMRQMVENFASRSGYGADLDFLTVKVWPRIKDYQIGHDSFSCESWPNSHPFPTRRPEDWQHVGQVFSESNEPRMSDISCCLHGPNPPACRKDPSWTKG